MADQETERQSAQQEAPGGRSSRGPEYGIAGEPIAGSPTPADEERGENMGEGAEGVKKAFDASNAGEPGPTPPVSDEERGGVGAADMDPEGPLGVGESRGGRGEDQAPDTDLPTKGAGRPVGRHGDEDTPGSVTPGSPDLPTGDQGG